MKPVKCYPVGASTVPSRVRPRHKGVDRVEEKSERGVEARLDGGGDDDGEGGGDQTGRLDLGSTVGRGRGLSSRSSSGSGTSGSTTSSAGTGSGIAAKGAIDDKPIVQTIICKKRSRTYEAAAEVAEAAFEAAPEAAEETEAAAPPEVAAPEAAAEEAPVLFYQCQIAVSTDRLWDD